MPTQSSTRRTSLATQDSRRVLALGQARLARQPRRPIIQAPRPATGRHDARRGPVEARGTHGPWLETASRTDFDQTRSEASRQFTTQMTFASVLVLVAAVLMSHGSVSGSSRCTAVGTLVVGTAALHGLIARWRLRRTLVAAFVQQGHGRKSAEAQAALELAKVCSCGVGRTAAGTRSM